MRVIGREKAVIGHGNRMKNVNASFGIFEHENRENHENHEKHEKHETVRKMWKENNHQHFHRSYHYVWLYV